MKQETLNKLLDRLDHMDNASVQNFLSIMTRQRGFFQQVFETIQEGIILLGPDGEIIFYNKSACNILRKNEDSLSLADLSLLLGRDFSWKHLQNSKVAVSRDIEITYPEHLFLNIYLSPIGDIKESGYLIVIRDETLSHAKTEAMMESEQLNSITLLAAGVAHEIGNPLNSIGLYLQLLDRKLDKLPPETASECKKLLKTASSETERLDQILKQFLQAIRPGKVEKSMADMNAIIRDILPTLTPELDTRGIHLCEELAETLPPLPLDALQIKQAIYNLIKNAYQAIPANSKGGILIKTESNNYEVKVTVSDSGTGISPEVMGSIYEPFLTTKSSGSGLGLLIVRRIVKEHGGTVTIASNPSKGTTITLFFPRPGRTIALLPQS